MTSEDFESTGEQSTTVPVVHTYVSEERLILSWKLTPEEFVFVSNSTIKKNFTWFEYCFLKTKETGVFLLVTDSLPYAVRAFINGQFSLHQHAEILIPNRDATRTEYKQKIIQQLGLEEVDAKVLKDLFDWALENASKGLAWAKIRDKIPETLKSWGVLIPPTPSLQKLSQTVITEAESALYAKISNTIAPSKKKNLDKFLERSENGKTSSLFTLKDFPKAITPKVIIDYIEKSSFLDDSDIRKIKLDSVSPIVVSNLANTAKLYDVYHLRRFTDDKRHAMLVCYLYEAQGKILDTIIKMNDVYLMGVERRSRLAFEATYKQLRRKSKNAIKTLVGVSKIVVSLEGEALSNSLAQNVDKPELRKAIEETESLRRLDERGHLNEILKRHSHIKHYLTHFLSLSFAAEKSAVDLLKVIEFYHKQIEMSLDDFDKEAPLWIIRPSFKSLYESSPKERRKIWEISLAFEVKEKLRILDLFLPDSRNHRSFWTMVDAGGTWKKRQEGAYENLSAPKSFTEFTARILEGFNNAYEHFCHGFDKNKFVELDKNGNLKFHKDPKTEQPNGVKDLLEAIRVTLPKHVPIEDVLTEVEQATKFTEKLRPQFALKRGEKEERTSVLAALLAHGNNIGLAGMASATRDITIDSLLETSQNRLTIENLTVANETLVQFHMKYPFSKFFEEESITSSEGQRFQVQEDSLNADFCTRYFGYYKRAINFVTHISNSGRVFSGQIISCGTREAMAMVNGLCKAGSDFYPEMHTTDTHGYTDALFVILHLLGIQFAPRLKDLGNVRLFAHEKFEQNLPLAVIFEKAKIQLDSLAPQWDDMVRIVSALKSGQVSAQSILPRIFACQSGDKLAQAFKKLGQVLKTTFLLRYFGDPKLRYVIRKQLNKGESRHSLARQIFFSNKGEFRSGDLDSLMAKSSCLSLVCNSILIWNTLATEKAIFDLESRGQNCDKMLLKFISPLSWEHIRINGRYDFRTKTERESSL
jgi:TnpA family transposase